MSTTLAPDLGIRFRYHDATFLTKGWWKPAPPKQIPDDADDLMRELWEEVIAEEAADGLTRMVRCERQDATHVSGGGICGCIAPISQIEEIDNTPVVPTEWVAELHETHSRHIGQILIYQGAAKTKPEPDDPVGTAPTCGM